MAPSDDPRSAGAVHLVVGEDSYLAEEALERILERAIGRQDRADALVTFHGDESPWAAVLAAARMGSLFTSRRAVVVRRADQFAEDRRADDEGAGGGEEAATGRSGERGRRAGPAKKEHVLLAYLDDPSPDVTLVLMAGRPDRRRNPWKRLAAEATLHSAEPKKGAALRGHVEQELRRRGLLLEPDALQDLIDEFASVRQEDAGHVLRRLMGELDKLEAWRGEGREALTAADVHEVLGRGLGRPLYLLADALAGRDLGRSLASLEELLEGGEEPLRILATLHRSIRQVRAAGAMARARAPREEIARALLPQNMQWKVDELLRTCRRWTDVQLRRALVALDQADRQVKRGADAATSLVAALAVACGAGEAATSPPAGR